MSRLPDLSATIDAVFTGTVENRWPGKPPSAIGKTSTGSMQTLGRNGFEEDSQADLKVHGGPEKAVHHYAADHMAYWREAFPDKADMFVPGCFGENISTVGLTEQNLCVGDILTLGSATVQISQGRQPCWKLGAHTAIARMPAAFQNAGFTGWYYRVLEGGKVQKGDTVRLIERPCPEWVLHRVIKARFDRALSKETASALANLTALSPGWRKAFRKMTDDGYTEDTTARLIG